MGHRFREAKRVIPYIDAMVEEEPFVVIAEGVDIIESRELAPLQKRLERLADQDAAVVFIGVYEDDYPHKREAVPFSNLMDVIISVPEPDTERKREILRDSLSGKATELGISVDLSELDCESVAEDASALDAYRLQKVADRAFMIAQTEEATAVAQSHMETAVEQVTEEQSEIDDDTDTFRRQSGDDYETESPDVSFDDVGGLDDVIDRIQSVVTIQEEYADIYEQTGFETSHGMLLAGPPGTGKTLLAKAVANELDRTFLSVKGAEMRNPWFGRTEQIIRELFEKADEEAPSVLFFDEFDALAGKRSKSSRSVNQSIVATLLTELDGMESRDDVLVIAATNRKDAIDEALLRPGRLDETITVPVPDGDGQAQIFDIHTDGVPTADDVTGGWFTQQVTDLTGAQIRQVCEETFRKAVQRKENPDELTLTKKDFTSAIDSLDHSSGINRQEPTVGYE
jgi:transitional endoplasmic reticulum ATPase